MDQDFKQLVDNTVRPQDDLFGHANNRWLNKSHIPDEEGQWGAFNELWEDNYKKEHLIVEELIKKTDADNSIEQKIRDFYKSAIAQDIEAQGLKTLKELFKQVNMVKDLSSLSSLLGALQLNDTAAFWTMYVDQDQKKSTDYIINFTQTGLSLPNRDYYFLKDKKMAGLRRGLQLHIDRMFKEVNLKVNDRALGSSIFKLEKKLAKASMTQTELRDVEAQYNKFSFKELKVLTPSIDWEEYFKALGIKPPQQLIVDQPDFLKCVDTIMRDTDLSTIKNYLKWHILMNSSSYLGDRIAQISFDFFGKELSGIKKMKPAWKRIIRSVNSCLGEAMGQLYIDRHFPDESKKRMEQLVEDLRVAFKVRIQDMSWMDAKTKKNALSKLAKMDVQVGYPKKLLKYETLDIGPDSYLKNILASNVDEYRRDLAKLGKPIDRDEWNIPPQTVNAMYSASLNRMIFPAGILQFPFFMSDAADAVNYGAIGMVIGHEMTHGFDDKGSQYDEKGNLHDWWTPGVKKKFNNLTKRMLEQAEAFEVLPGKKLNGQLTLGENIADLGGAEIAFHALQMALKRSKEEGHVDGYRPKQAFFLSYARIWRYLARDELKQQYLIIDFHAPGDFRTNNTARNMDGFYEAFGVQPTDTLYLPQSQRVRIW